MRRRLAAAVVVLLVATLGVAVVTAQSTSVDIEVRIAAQRLADGRTEFALQHREPGGEWSERLLPRARFFPASTAVGRWLVSTPLTVAVPGAPVVVPEGRSGVESDRGYLLHNALDGSIPPELGNLTSLTDLALIGNELSGPIPPELGNLVSLDRLRLDGNALSGPIPPELGKLSALTELYLSHNALDGPIPPDLADLASLSLLWLNETQLSGSIPPELGGLTSLRVLWLEGNELRGRSRRNSAS